MSGPASAARLRVPGGGLLAALLLLACWLPVHPASPPLPTADLYTHLSVARHLDRGEGFRSDVAYPLSFAFDFARELPQPLIHRGPVYPLLLVLPYRLAGGDPAATVAAVRGLQIALLALTVWLGTAALLRRGRTVSVAPWLVLVAANPLLVFAVDWGFEELLCGLLLLAVWLRAREGQVPGPWDGLAAGVLTLLRLDLFWVPVLWWVWFGLERRRAAAAPAGRSPAPVPGPRRTLVRGLLTAVLLMALVQLPWAARNLQLTGRPFFTLQGQAELVKDTRSWPGYSVYLQLEPQPAGKVLAGDPVPVLRKTARGLKFFVLEAHKLLPLPYLLLGVLLVVALLRGVVTGGPCLFRRDRTAPMSILPGAAPLGPLAAATATLLLLAGQYSFFDHSLRHLLPLVPLFLWECAPLTGDLAVGVMSRHLPSWPARPRLVPELLVSALVTGLVVWASWAPAEGWLNARRQARQAEPGLQARVEAFRQDPAAVPFVADAAVTWYADRPAVWDPQDQQVRQTIRRLLAR